MMKLKLVAAVGLMAVALSSCFDIKNNTDTSSQFGQDTMAIKAYLAINGIPATKLPTEGIWIIYDQNGSGAHANFSDTITLTYKMSLLSNGNVVDDHSSTPISFNLSNLIPGLQIALPLFPIGSKGRVFIPSSYAYQGSTGLASIPPNSNLLFEFTVLGVTDYHLKADTVAIDKYIADNSIANVIKDASGIRYTVDTVGSGLAIPDIGDVVTCTYSGKLLDGTILLPQVNQAIFPVSESFLAWKIALPFVKEGTVMTIYSPSTYAYGSNPTNATIPQNANVIFKLKLVKVN